MSFSTLLFPFVFLPIAIILYYISPKKIRSVTLLVLSLLFFAWGNPAYLLLMLCSIAMNYFAGLELGHHLQAENHRRAKTVLTVSVIANLLLLGFFKYYGFLLDNINALLHLKLPVRTYLAPIGLSFYTFSLLSYLFDVYRGKAEMQRNLLSFSLYVTFFPKLISGPIMQYHDFEAQLISPRVNLTKLGDGVRLFLIGLAKKLLLADVIGTSFYAMQAQGVQSTFGAWVEAISYTLMLYFDFGGYSDMAIGLGKMLGFELPKNFEYPYLCSSITDFWRRWHISLGSWFRDYVYIPLGGSREGQAKTIRNLMIVWLLTGLWHGASWTFIIWGLYYGILLILEKFVLKKVVDVLPSFLRHLLTVLLVVVGWVFFFSGSISEAFGTISRMFGKGAFLDSTAKYYFSGCWKILLVGIFACFPIGARIGMQVYRRSERAVVLLSVLYFGLLLLLCIAAMVGGTYSSFLYFQF
ncbi:MAG: MBOAT family protein [Clostridia bacterium]|nr:MBOAT family protein [Clostridia bacterium]